MDDWLESLPVVWMAGVIFAVAYLATALIYFIVHLLAVRPWDRAFRGASHGIPSPLGTLLGLMLAFMAAQVWSDSTRRTPP